MRLTTGAALEHLALSLFAQEVDRLIVEVDCSDALCALRRTETEGFPLSRVLLPDRQTDPIEIYIAPPEAEQLAAPHARGGGNVVERELPVLRREGQEGGQFVSGPCPHLGPILRLGVGPLRGIATQQAIVDGVLQRFAKADVDVVHCLLAEPAPCKLPIEAADAKPVDHLQRYVTESRADVVMDAHAIVACRVGTDVAARGQPVLKIGPESAPASLDVCPVDHGRLESVHRFQSRGFRRETATEALLALRAGQGKVDDERPAE